MNAGFHRRAIRTLRSLNGKRFRSYLEEELTRVRGRAFPYGMGVPLLVRSDFGAHLARFSAAYHRSVEAVMRAWFENDEVRRVIALPSELTGMLDSTRGRDRLRIHLCRPDLVLLPDGGFVVVETNANCPGGLQLIGRSSRAWREYLSGVGCDLPSPLDHEARAWMASWYVRTAQLETDRRPEFVALLRRDGGNRLSLPGLATELRQLGVDAVEADPRAVTRARGGGLFLADRALRHAYWKLAMRDFRDTRGSLTDLIAALQNRSLFVQNGLVGRFIGDNKLCLAVLSDPTFDYLFDPVDLAYVRPHLAWARNIGLCSPGEIRSIKANRLRYVLKRALDTRGHGVLIGPEVPSRRAWEAGVERAVREDWLVQEFYEPARLDTEVSGRRVQRYCDLSLVLHDGRLVGAMSRSSGELRTNVAQTGRLHSVYLEA